MKKLNKGQIFNDSTKLKRPSSLCGFSQPNPNLLVRTFVQKVVFTIHFRTCCIFDWFWILNASNSCTKGFLRPREKVIHLVKSSNYKCSRFIEPIRVHCYRLKYSVAIFIFSKKVFTGFLFNSFVKIFRKSNLVERKIFLDRKTWSGFDLNRKFGLVPN